MHSYTYHKIANAQKWNVQNLFVLKVCLCKVQCVHTVVLLWVWQHVSTEPKKDRETETTHSHLSPCVARIRCDEHAHIAIGQLRADGAWTEDEEEDGYMDAGGRCKWSSRLQTPGVGIHFVNVELFSTCDPV